MSGIMRVTDFAPEKEKDNICGDEFEIHWKDIRYTVSNSLLNRGIRRLQGFKETPKIKEILHGISGCIRAGELMAFMGPSGCGKTTLLECIVGKRKKGRRGDALLFGENLNKISVSFIPQRNDFLNKLTVRETIMFATKLQVANKVHDESIENLKDRRGKVVSNRGGKECCSAITNSIIADLGLEVCENNRVSNCSGGQLKRLAIAEQLVGKPRILILDEPTSGLDSVSCFQVINILLNLTQQEPKMAILATIHQPSLKILNLFHKLYVMSENGDCVFDDKPANIVDNLNKFGFYCPEFYNPADFIMEVVSEEQGGDKLKNMSTAHKNLHNSPLEQRSNTNELSELQKQKSYPFLIHVWILCLRHFIVTIRDPLVFGLSFGSTAVTALYQVDLFTTQVGIRGGCPPNLGADFEPSILDDIADEIEDEFEAVFNNTGNMLFAIMLVLFNAMMPTSVAFPNELHVFKMQKENSWYDTLAFFVGKVASEIPFHVFVSTMYVSLLYPLQNHPPELWRFLCFYFILLLCQFIAQSMAYIISTIFMNNLPAAAFLTPVISYIPFMLVSGLFIKIKSMSPIFRLISYTSYFRFALEGILVTFYGFQRCTGEAVREHLKGKEAFVVWLSAMLGVYGGEEGSDGANTTESAPTEKFVEELTEIFSGDFTNERNEVGSAAMNINAFEDWYLYRAFISLIITLIILRLIAFQLIKFRIKSAN